MATVSLHLKAAGYCVHPEFITVRGGQLRPIRFPATFALLEHSRLGIILIDTGYSSRFYEVTRPFPERIYSWITPVHMDAGQSAVAQLAQSGIAASDVRHILLSHFHADHIGGTLDFPKARFFCCRRSYDALRSLNRLQAIKAGYLSRLLPADFEQRLQAIEIDTALPQEYAPFQSGKDVFGDGTVFAIPLAGHSVGHMGFIVNSINSGVVFLIVDACWHSRTYRDLLLPHRAASIALSDPLAYRNTIQDLHLLYHRRPDLPMLPCHCPEVYAHYIDGH